MSAACIIGFASAEMVMNALARTKLARNPTRLLDRAMAVHPGSEIERLIQLLAKLPGLGPRSARRAALALLKKRDTLLEPLARGHARSGRTRSRPAKSAAISIPPSPAPSAAIRAAIAHVLCVVEDVADLWALERAGVFRGRYHVLGGALSRAGRHDARNG